MEPEEEYKNEYEFMSLHGIYELRSVTTKDGWFEISDLLLEYKKFLKSKIEILDDNQIKQLAFDFYGTDCNLYGGQRDGYKEGFKAAQKINELQFK